MLNTIYNTCTDEYFYGAMTAIQFEKHLPFAAGSSTRTISYDLRKQIMTMRARQIMQQTRETMNCEQDSSDSEHSCLSLITSLYSELGTRLNREFSKAWLRHIAWNELSIL